MTDYFAVLHQPRRPWIDAEALKQTYHRLTLSVHSDAGTGSSSTDSAGLNDAYRSLKDPKSRLQHLLALESAEQSTTQPSVPEDIADLFAEAGILAHDIDAILTTATGTTTRLAQSLLKPRVADVAARTATILAKLEELYDGSLSRLRAVDSTWDSDANWETLRQLHRRLSYLTRWLEQFRERSFQLSQAYS